MSHTWNFELKIYVKWLIKFRRWIVQKMKVSTIVDFRGFKIRDRHNSSTWVIVKFLFSIFKNSIRVMIKYNFRPFETLQRPENPRWLCAIYCWSLGKIGLKVGQNHENHQKWQKMAILDHCRGLTHGFSWVTDLVICAKCLHFGHPLVPRVGLFGTLDF